MASKLFSLIPPSDLLRRVEGVENGLRRGKRAQDLGVAGLLVALVQVVAVLVSSKWWGGLSDSGWAGWVLAVAVLVIVVSVVLLNWTRLWVRESRQPFRYTYSIDHFEPVAGTEADPRLAWLRDDLSKQLSERITRLSLLDPRYSGEVEPGDSHIHIGGSYGIRGDKTSAIEVMPWIRLGPKGEAAKLAHPVTLPLPEGGLASPDGGPAYRKLVERIYFSIASRLYAQIRLDVQHKIELLPRRYYRAAAYFYEAEDYVASNTLDAYDAAKELYEAVIVLYDACWSRTAQARPARALQKLDRLHARWSLFWRRHASAVWPALGRVELMVWHGHVGYAKTLLYRRQLAGVSGQTMNPIFEARPVAHEARKRIERLPEDVPGQREILFEALVVEAYANAALGSATEAERLLKRARAREPARAELDPLYLFIRSLASARPIQYLQAATDLAPLFEVAQFNRALAVEMIWRQRRRLEPNVANIVIDTYERVLGINPANIAAWANLGYTHWLLAEGKDAESHREAARSALERGRDYKEIRPETFVAELDYGLARIAAEDGDFDTAYRHYISAIAAQVAQGVSHAKDFTSYHFAAMTDAMLRRFERYKDAVQKSWENPAPGAAPRRVRDSVYAFVLNDYGEACVNYWLRTGSFEHLAIARHVLTDAKEKLRTRYPMVSMNLSRLERWNRPSDLADASDEAILDKTVDDGSLLDMHHADELAQYEPHWADGILEQVLSHAVLAQRARALEQRLNALASEREAARVAETADQGSEGFAPGGRPTSFQEKAAKIARRPTGPTYGADPATAASWDLQEPWLTAVAPDAAAFAENGAGQTPIDLEAEAARLRERAAAARRRTEDSLQKAMRLSRALLPHEWLWTNDHEFAFPVVRRKDYLRERRWEREFDDLHFSALIAWCQTYAIGLGDTPRTDDPLLGLLELMRARFSSADFDLLDLCRTLRVIPDPTRKECAKLLADVVRRNVAQYPTFVALGWVLPDPQEAGPALFDPAQVLQLLDAATSERDLPPRFSVWVGDQLHALDHGSAALKAYRNALASRDPDVLAKLGDRLEEVGELDRALDAYCRAREYDAKQGHPRPDAYRLAIGRVLWKLRREHEAMKELDAIDGTAEDVPATWRADLARTLIDAETITDPGSYRLLKRWLGRDLTAAQARDDVVTRRDAGQALLLLTRSRYRALVRRGDDDGFAATLDTLLPIVRPIMLEADSDFFPDGERTPQVQRMLNAEIPALRDHVAAHTGIDVPGVLITPSPQSGTRHYRIYLHELPVATGVVGDEHDVFVPDASGLGPDGYPGVDPLTGRTGRWVGNHTAGNSASTSWDHYTHMLRHLHAVLLGNAHQFVTMQQLELMSGAPEDEHAKIRLVGVLRALARERVPLPELADELADDVMADSGGELPLIVERARVRLRGVLPVADADVQLALLGPELEDRINRGRRSHGGKEFLALPPEEVEALRRAITDQLAGRRDLAVVVLTPGLRRFVRRLVEVDADEIAVVARSELPAVRLAMPLASPPVPLITATP